MHERASAIALAVGLGVCVSGCSGDVGATDSAQAAQPVRGGTVRVGILQEPATMNPYILASGVVDGTVFDPMSDPLVERGPDGQPRPVVAAEAPTLENGLVELAGNQMRISVPIRPEAAWNDGTPLTCRDVRFTWQTIMDERWLVLSRRGWDKVRAVECPHPKRAVIRLRVPLAAYWLLLEAVLLPEHDLRGRDFNRAWIDDVPVSNGPFEFERWERGTAIHLRRNPRYWRADQRLPRLERIELRFLQDQNTLSLQLSTGEIDVVARPLTVTLERDRATFPRSTYVASPQAIVNLFSFNHDHEPFSNVHVRRAVAHAIDREQIVDKVLGEPFQLLDSTLVPQLGEYFSTPFSRYRADEDAVRANLAKAGYTRAASGWYERRGEPLTIRYKGLADRGTNLLVAQLVQQQLERAGIRMQITLETPQVFFGQTLRRSAFDLIYWDHGVDGLPPVQRSFFHCEPSRGFSNAARYCNRDVSDWIDRTERELDPREQVRLTRRIQRALADDLAALPLHQRLLTYVHAPALRGIEPNPHSRNMVGWDAAHWWWSDPDRSAAP